jgi:16S rRNA (cytosine1402-N4)-methyltransferase
MEVHRPVLVREVLDLLVTKADGVYIDGTVGAGGHAGEILKRLGAGGRLLGIDRDSDILKAARDRLGADARVDLHHGSFDEISGDPVDGVLLDLGVSSLQLDRAERGFSFSKDAPLDMRMNASMDASGGQSAKDLVASASERELEKILREYGEEPFARRIAGMIIETRRRSPILTTTDLAVLVSRAVPRRAWPKKIHVATRTFQALRIAVNGEMERLERFLREAPGRLKAGGRLAVISYHSLEDRRVKQAFVEGERTGVLRRITKKPVTPSEDEIRENPRARSAKLRVAEKEGANDEV